MSLEDEFAQEVRNFKQFLETRDAQRRQEPDVYGVVHRSTQHLESPTRFSAVEKRNEIRGDNTPFLCGGVGRCNRSITAVVAGQVSDPADNGTWTVPFQDRTFPSGTEQCNWSLLLPSGNTIVVFYVSSFEPIPWGVLININPTGESFQGGATLGGTDGILNSPIANQNSGVDAGSTVTLSF